jgi:hypothetical protein
MIKLIEQIVGNLESLMVALDPTSLSLLQESEDTLTEIYADLNYLKMKAKTVLRGVE